MRNIEACRCCPPGATLRHDAVYLVGHAAEVPVKSAQESFGQARVVPVDLPKRRRGPAEGFLLRCVLGREIPESCTLALF